MQRWRNLRMDASKGVHQDREIKSTLTVIVYGGVPFRGTSEISVHYADKLSKWLIGMSKIKRDELAQPNHTEKEDRSQL